MSGADRALLGIAGICGAAGVALSAVAAHAGGGNVGTAASMLLMHAPVLLAIALFGASRLLRNGGFVLAIGLLIFAGDLLTRQYLGGRLFPLAAPIGGVMLIGGWIVIAASALTIRR